MGRCERRVFSHFWCALTRHYDPLAAATIANANNTHPSMVWEKYYFFKRAEGDVREQFFSHFWCALTRHYDPLAAATVANQQYPPIDSLGKVYIFIKRADVREDFFPIFDAHLPGTMTRWPLRPLPMPTIPTHRWSGKSIIFY